MNTLRKLVLKKRLHENSFFTHQMVARTIHLRLNNRAPTARTAREVLAALRNDNDAVDRLVEASVAQFASAEDVAKELLSLYAKEAKGHAIPFSWDDWLRFLIQRCYVHAEIFTELTISQGVDVVSRAMDDYLITRIRFSAAHIRRAPDTLTIKIP